MVRAWLACLCLSVVAASAWADDKLSPRHVSVTGTATTHVQPDAVVWRVVVRRQDKDLAKAQAACDEGVRKVLALRGEHKLKPEDVQTGYLSIQKIYDRDQWGNQTSFRHFQVERAITLRQHDLTKFDQILSAFVATGDLETSYSLESSKFLEVRMQTRLDAVKIARQKATAMAEALGAKVGRALRIAEPVEGHGALGVGNFMTNSAVVGVRAAEIDQAGGTLAPGSIDVRVSIEVTFELE